MNQPARNQRKIPDAITRTASLLPFQPTESENRPGDYQFVLTTSEVDSEGDIIRTDGVQLEQFTENPVALYMHDRSRPIGSWIDVQRHSDKITGWLKLAEPGTLPDADTARALLDQGIVKTCSVGLRVLDYDLLENGWSLDITRSRLSEVSIVTVPANASAKRIKSDSNPRPGGQTRRSASTNTPPSGVKPMNLSEKIVAKQDRLGAIGDELAILSNLDQLSEDDEQTLAVLVDEQQSVTRELESYRILEQALADRAQPVKMEGLPTHLASASASPGYVGGENKKAEDVFFKMAAASVLAFHEKKSMPQVLEERYKNDQRMLAVQKSASGIADSTTAGWAAELVDEGMRGFLDLLRPVSVYAQLASLGTSIDFGTYGSLKIPGRKSGKTVNGAFVGESGAIPVKSIQTEAQTLNRYKMAVISTFSKEVAEYSTPQIESLVRTAMVGDTAEALDAALLDGAAAVQGVRPASILNGITPTASAGNTAENIITDLKAAWAPMLNGNGGRAPVIIMNSGRRLGLQTVTVATGGFLFREELNSGRLLGLRVIDSTAVPAGTVIVTDAADFATALGTPMFYTSEETTLVMADADASAPTHAADAAGTIGTADQVPPDGGVPVSGGAGAAAAGATAVSMFQTHSLALKMVMPVCWQHLRPALIGSLSGAAW